MGPMYFYPIVIIGFLIPILAIVYVIYSLITEIFGAPFVPTSGKIVDEILKKANLKKGQNFVELGSGDGRVVIKAVKDYGVKGVGIELNYMLIIFSRLMAKLSGLKNIEFKTENFFKTDLSKTDVVFLFLLPRTLKNLREKFLRECKKGTLVISHGFRIEGWEKYLVKTIERDLYPTYYYKI